MELGYLVAVALLLGLLGYLEEGLQDVRLIHILTLYRLKYAKKMEMGLALQEAVGKDNIF